MRTRPLVAASALIAVVALVASAAPGRSQAPRPIEPMDSTAFARLVPPPLASRTPAPPARQALSIDEPVIDPGAPPLPSTRPAPEQPRAAIGVVVKPRPTPRPTPRPQTATGGGSWQRAEYSWYGTGFYGSGTACGQTYSKTILGVAHKTLPCGTRVTFRNPKNGRTITVRVIDRGPYVAGRMWDLSYATCSYLGNCYTSIIQYRLP